MKYDKCARCGKNMTPPNGVGALIGAVLSVKMSEGQKENPDYVKYIKEQVAPYEVDKEYRICFGCLIQTYIQR